ncbi:hypothetical protein FJY94_01075 [Candidatus Kaiserbacteria bacterium]|nr:hypothetical protein [Candidatus Kaiserbacteria bacterium]
MSPVSAERPRVVSQRFRTPEEELAYLRERVARQQEALEATGNTFERDRIARRELKSYADVPPAAVLHEEYVMPEAETITRLLNMTPETHDKQIDHLLAMVAQNGIRNALTVASRAKNPHLEDDFHRSLVRYLAEGLPDVGTLPERTRRALGLVLFEIEPQAHAGEGNDAQREVALERLLSSSEQLYAGLMALTEEGEGFSLEIAVPEGTEEASLYLAVPHEKKGLAERLLASVFPNARVSESRGDYNIFNYDGEHAAAYAQLAAPPALPIKTPDMFDHDPLNVLLAAFAKIAKHGEGAAVQIIVSSEGDRYNKHFQKMLRQFEKGKGRGEAFSVPETLLGDVVHDMTNSIFFPDQAKKDAEKSSAVDQAAVEEVGRKLKSRIAPVSVRIVASAPTYARAHTLVENLKAPFSQYDNPRGNRFAFKDVSTWWGFHDFLRAFTYREFDASIAMPLSLAELTSVFHFTAERVTTSRELKKSHSKQAPAPVELAQDGIVIGLNHYGATETRVHFGAADRLRHCYVIGQTGTGKTSFIKNMIRQDIERGDGVAFIDPHGSDIEEVLAFVPPERAGDVIYFDPAYTARPMGLNLLEYDTSHPEMKTYVVDAVYDIFRKLYSDIPDAFGPMFEQYYRNAAQLVVEDPASGSTLMEITRVLADASFRSLKLARCKNPVVVQFWRKIAEQAGGESSLENIVPYVSSKTDVFLSNDIMRPIVAQQESAFDFRQIMDTKKIFLANLSKGRLGDRNAQLLGLVIVSKFVSATFSRIDARGEVPPFYLYIDEFQNFATPSIATILSEARKYKLSLTIAHQFIAQLDDDIRDAVIGNVGTKLAMRLGTTDAEFLEKQFAPTFSAHDLEYLPNFNAVASLLVNDIPARPFTLQSEPPRPVDFARVDALKELSYQTYGRAREEVEAEVRRKFGITG